MSCKPASLRKIISVIVFLLFLLLFFGSEMVSVILSSLLLPLQIGPALIHSLTSPSVLVLSGLALVGGLCLIFGRIYCSFLCPLGTLQDFFILLSRKLKLHTRHSFYKPDNLARYSLLGLTFVTAVTGSLTLFNLLDPYSIFSRIINQIGEPLFNRLLNTVIEYLRYFDIYMFTRSVSHFPFSVFLITMFFFLLIAFMSLVSGRRWCNTLCPAGTLLGLIGKAALFKFTIAPSTCNNCRKCEGVCKAGCIDAENLSVDQSRCVGCFNCLQICPQFAILYRPAWKNTFSEGWSPQRRNFIFASLAATGSIILAVNSNIRGLTSSLFTRQTPLPVTPPGSLGLTHFSQTCTACQLCASACPTKVITPAILEYGAAGIMQPKMDYEQSYCDYECNICGRVCPTGAIKPYPLEEKKLIQIGTAELLQDRCIVYVKKQNCGACLEVCPTHALSSVNKDNILYPETDKQYCIGCGACEKACPTAPKSIIVQSHPLHKKAAKYTAPAIVAPKEKQQTKDFPF